MDRRCQLIPRRRLIRIGAAAAALGTLAFGHGRPLAAPPTGDETLSIWRGITLGTLTQIEIRHPDRTRGRRVLTAALREIDRLESIVSLYRPDSALIQLNRNGVLADPPLDLVRLLSEARSFSEITGGCFDVSVQPLWRVYADHFFTHPADSPGPPEDAIRRAADLVDYKAIEFDSSSVHLRCQGMALTLNGIAQATSPTESRSS